MGILGGYCHLHFSSWIYMVVGLRGQLEISLYIVEAVSASGRHISFWFSIRRTFIT